MASAASGSSSSIMAKKAKLVPASGAMKTLAIEMQGLLDSPVGGFSVKLVDDDDIFLWEATLFGPPDTLFQGGYFKAHIAFPNDYPFSPPEFKFLPKPARVWHPNVWPAGQNDGAVCISILDPPTKNKAALEQSGVGNDIRWNPTQNVRTILLSVVSLFNEPNENSPANPDANRMYLAWKRSGGKEAVYEQMVKKYVKESQEQALLDGVVVPLTSEEYCRKPEPKVEAASVMPDLGDFYDDDEDDSDDYGEDSQDDDDYDSDEKAESRMDTSDDLAIEKAAREG